MTSGTVSRVRLHENARVRVTVDPYTSVLALACAAVAAHREGGDALLAARLSGREQYAISRLVVPGASVAPEALTPAVPERDTDVAVELERLRSMSADELYADIDTTWAGAPPAHWEDVAEQGPRWLSDLADALHAVWQWIEPAWAAQDRLRSKEIERVGTAAARGALDLVLARAHPRGRIVDGVLEFPDPEGIEPEPPQTVVLAPLLSGVDVSISNLERPGQVWFGYPAPRPESEDETGLAALLTPVRAALLRLLGTQWSMSGLAARVGLSPATLTHQITALVADGLVVRHRDGRRTLVRRTVRGTALLDLYGVSDLPGGPGSR
ncbi:ArsR/SmtB family transcription factor [Pseudonocardia endophytica]|uniref:Helix-turn-helix protein n=1 Tax=Pseudonocardia endophytica TaxID=401976 RepID=A0A4R1HUR4_PSEEN|nr:winged helix-turn-helix domain-containing protein [Pseudonocardia endophytica]TCK26454.1 helix-turn-helix protein [Pseudonocardia endophytica]